MIYSTAFPFGEVIAGILRIPSVSTFPVFTGLKEILDDSHEPDEEQIAPIQEVLDTYKAVSRAIEETYSVKMPDRMMHLMFNWKGRK